MTDGLLTNPKEILATLRDMEQRSRQGRSKLAQQANQNDAWTAIGFRIAQQHFLIALSDTREIFTVPQQITLVPKSQPWVFGIANLRGELLPLFDLKHFLYGQPTKINKRSRIVVINYPDLYSGLLIDEVFGLKHLQQQPEQNDSPAHVAHSMFINGSITHQDIKWDVFNVSKLCIDTRFLQAAI